MTLQEFLIKWNGKYCEVAGSSAVNQCVDLANAYIRDVLNLPIIEWTNATNFPDKAGDAYYYIANTPTGVPLEGDIAVWDGAIGHIAIFLEGNANRFTSFDQNYPTGSPCHIQGHTYANVKGWLRKKQLPVVPAPIPQDPTLQPMSTVYSDIHKSLTGKNMPDDTKAFRVQQGWNTIQVIEDYLKNDSDAKAYWKVGTTLANYSAFELLGEALKKLKP